MGYATAMNFPTWAEGKPILADYARLNDLIQETVYTDKIKAELLQIMSRHKGLITNEESKFICLRYIRGSFISHTRNKPAEVVANGRDSWIGWFELQTEPITETAIENTARVIGLLNTDVLCVVEIEDRNVLKEFNTNVLSTVGVNPFGHVRLFQGEDHRSINVGIMTKQDYWITRMLSHVDDTDDEGVIFSRDCAEYEIETPQHNTLLLLVNHFKSKGYGDFGKSAKKRYSGQGFLDSKLGRT